MKRFTEFWAPSRALGVAMAGVMAVGTMMASNAGAAELRYDWKAGQSQRFHVTSTQTLSMGGMMAMNARFDVESTFRIAVKKVLADGTADAVLHVESFSVKDANGRTMAGVDAIPKRALTNLVEIDPKGRFLFKEIVYLLVDEKHGSLLVGMKVGPNGASGTARAGDQEVSVYAEFDPKTGTARAGASIRKVKAKKPRKRKIPVERQAQRVDVLPLQLMELMRLPDGNLSEGDTASMDAAGYRIATNVRSLTAKAADIQVRITSAEDAGSARAAGNSSAKVDSAGGSMAVDMGGMPGMAGMDGMGGMGGMPGMGGMGGGPDGGDPDPGAAMVAGGGMMKMTGEFAMHFNVRKGMLDGVEGTLNTSVGMGGMGAMKTDATFKLARIR